MNYSDKDLERAKAFLSEHKDSSYHLDHSAHEMADLIADVRRETVEECLRIADRSWAHDVPRRIRALLDEPKAEPGCKVCGSTLGLGPHMQFFNHAFEPEEPGHG